MSNNHIFTINCPSASGIVSAVSSCLTESGCYISELAQFDDDSSGTFFMRTVFRFNEGAPSDIERLRTAFAPIANRFDMKWQLLSAETPMRVLLMVSKLDHCFADLLYRMKKQELRMTVTAVVSNHLELRPMAEREGIRYIYLPITPESKPRQEERLLETIEETGTELVVLARYMQILSDGMCERLYGRAINIHHSFLPGFKGAKPYHQAFERGVKLIGATAHYVTRDLDEGPIIEQAVQRVDHTMTPSGLAAIGRQTETIALAQAVRYHLESRVFLNNNRTVIFR